MSEEAPGVWELQRSLAKLSTDLRDGLAQLNTRLDSMVGSGVYAADQRRVDDRIKEIHDDVTQEREARKEAVKELSAAMERTALWLRWVASAIIVPTVLVIVNIVFNLGGVS